MTQRRKLELNLNTPTEIELLFDDPIIGNSQYGEYAMYGVKTQEAEFSFFAPPEIHERLQHKRKGDVAIVQKVAVQKGTKVVTSFKIDFPPDTLGQVEVPEEQVAASAADDSEESDKYYSIMLRSYKESFRLQAELGGMVDIEKCAITLFIARSK